jgi:hypothetical protein
MCAYRSSPVTLHSVRTNIFVASTDAPAIAEETGTRPARQNSLSTETLEALEKRLSQRPERQELQDRNILKGASAQSEVELGFNCDHNP